LICRFPPLYQCLESPPAGILCEGKWYPHTAILRSISPVALQLAGPAPNRFANLELLRRDLSLTKWLLSQAANEEFAFVDEFLCSHHLLYRRWRWNGDFRSSACWRRNTRIGIKRSRCSGRALKCESKGRVRAISSEHSRKGARPASKPTARISFRCGCSSLPPPPPLPSRRKSTDHDSRHRQRLFRLNLGDCDWFGNA
jgi:hypothetical protein